MRELIINHEKKNKKLVLIGSGGHASVVMSVTQALGLKINVITVPNTKTLQNKISNIEYMVDEELLQVNDKAKYLLINGVGQKIGHKLRAEIFYKFKKSDFVFQTVIHPFSYIDPTSEISEGVQIMAGVILQNNCFVGENSIINTKSSIDHSSKIGSSCHVAPGAVVCGDVLIGNNCFIGSGAIVTEGTKLADNTIVKAGQVVKNK